MAENKEVLKYLKLSVNVEHEPGEEIREHLKQTVLGTPGKLRYKLTSFDTKFPYLGRIYFLILRKAEKLLGSIAFSLRSVPLGGKEQDAWYIRYFSVNAPLRDKTFELKRMKRAERKEKKKNNPHGDSLLKNFAQPYFDDPDHYLLPAEREKSSGIVYAYVERENLRSWNFTELAGFETVGKIRTSIFSRYQPRQYPGVSRIAENEKPAMLERLNAFYKGYTFYTTQNIFYGNHYLVCKKDGEILAGCQANPEVWELFDYPGGINRFLMKHATRLPVIRKMFVPGYQKFIAVEGIWYREGCEKYLNELFETALAMHGLYTLIVWLDGESPLYAGIRGLVRFGFFDRIFTAAEVDIRVKFNAAHEEYRQACYDLPAYISCFDMT